MFGSLPKMAYPLLFKKLNKSCTCCGPPSKWTSTRIRLIAALPSGKVGMLNESREQRWILSKNHGPKLPSMDHRWTCTNSCLWSGSEDKGLKVWISHFGSDGGTPGDGVRRGGAVARWARDGGRCAAAEARANAWPPWRAIVGPPAVASDILQLRTYAVE